MRWFQFCSAATILLGLTLTTLADPRPFTFTTDAYPVGKGGWEYEQWITYQGHKKDDHDFSRFDFRHEFEFGVADNVDLAFYFPQWRWEREDGDTNVTFQGGAAETVIYFLNP